MGVALLVPLWRDGHVTPVAVIGRALRALGWRVVVLVGPDFAGQLGDLEVRHPKRWHPDAPLPAAVAASRDPAAVMRHLVMGSVVDMVEDVTDEVHAIDADVVVGDLCVPGAGLAAERLGLPWATTTAIPPPSPTVLLDYVDPLMRPCLDAASTRAELGLPPRPENLLTRISPYLHLLPSTPWFAGAVDLPPQVRLVGPMVDSARGATARPPGRPRIVATTSSDPWMVRGEGAFRQRRFLRVLTEAVDGMDVDLVVVNPTGVGAEHPAPANVRHTGRLPVRELDALTDTCSAVVSHGGWGSVAKALLRELPLIIAPTGSDQFHNAQRCDELGLGIALDPVTVEPARVRAAIEAVCADDSYRLAAARFAAEVRLLDPPTTAAELVVGLRSTADPFARESW